MQLAYWYCSFSHWDTPSLSFWVTIKLFPQTTHKNTLEGFTQHTAIQRFRISFHKIDLSLANSQHCSIQISDLEFSAFMPGPVWLNCLDTTQHIKHTIPRKNSKILYPLPLTPGLRWAIVLKQLTHGPFLNLTFWLVWERSLTLHLANCMLIGFQLWWPELIILNACTF